MTAYPPAPPPTGHTCHVTDCPELVPTYRLMCIGHWRQTPKHLREAVEATWAMRRDHPSPEATRDHVMAASAAVRAVEAKILKGHQQLPGL